MVVTDHEQERVAGGVRRGARHDPRQVRPDPAWDVGHGLAAISDEAERVVVVRDLVRGEHTVARWRVPPEFAPKVLALVPHAAREHIGVVPEAAQELRHLRGMTEWVGHVRDARRASERSGDPQPLLEIADQRLTGDQEQVGEHVPGTDEQPIRADERLDPPAIAGADGQVVLERDRLAIEGERAEPRLALEQIEQVAEHRHQLGAEALEPLVPLAVPVGVRDDERAPGEQAQHPRDDRRGGKAPGDADDGAAERVERVMDADEDPRQPDRERQQERERPEAREALAERDGRAKGESRVAGRERIGGGLRDDRRERVGDREERARPPDDDLDGLGGGPGEDHPAEDRQHDPEPAPPAPCPPHHDAEQPPHQTLEVQIRDGDGHDRDERVARRDHRGVEVLIERQELVHQGLRTWRQMKSPTAATMSAATR